MIDRVDPTLEVPDFSPDPHLMDYLLLVARHKWAVISLVFFCGALALGLTYVVPYTYEAETMLLPPDRVSSSGLLDALNAGGALKILKEVENPSVDLIQDLIESRAIGERIARDSVMAHFFAPRVDGRDDFLAKIHNAIVVYPEVSRVKVKGIISTGWFSSAGEKEESRSLSAYVVNLAVRSMDSLMQAKLYANSHQTRVYSDSDYALRTRDLDSLDLIEEHFEQVHGVPAIKAQTLATIGHLAELEAARDEASIRLALLRRDFSNENPRVLSLTAEVAEADAVTRRYSSESRIGPSLAELPEVTQHYAEIIRKKAALEPIVTFLRQESEQQRITEERMLSVITIVDTANAPDHRSGPLRVPVAELGVTIGIVLSILYVGARSFLTSWKDTLATTRRGRSTSV